MGKCAFEGRTRTVRRMRGCRTAVDLVPAIIAHAGIEYGGGGRLEDGKWDITRWLKEGKIGCVEEGSGARGARATKDTAAFATMLHKVLVSVEAGREG
jgi:hypothetical protein